MGQTEPDRGQTVTAMGQTEPIRGQTISKLVNQNRVEVTQYLH